jgi:hypothetical protein
MTGGPPGDGVSSGPARRRKAATRMECHRPDCNSDGVTQAAGSDRRPSSVGQRVVRWLPSIIGAIAVRLRDLLPDTSLTHPRRRRQHARDLAVRDILIALREPPAKTFAACASTVWLQRDLWRRTIDAALAEVSEDRDDQRQSDATKLNRIAQTGRPSNSAWHR